MRVAVGTTRRTAAAARQARIGLHDRAMELMLLRLFQRQVELQCRILLVSASQLQQALNARSSEIDVTPQLWGSVQSLLSAAANLSKAFWGQRGQFSEERWPLRDSLQITDDSPLRPTSMRNNFDHFDERLDEWWATSETRTHFDTSVMPPAMVSGVAETDMFRVLDPTTAELVFWGDRYDLRAIVTEVQRILPIAETEADKPHWEPPPSADGSGQ
jgi:hypothetical protein